MKRKQKIDNAGLAKLIGSKNGPPKVVGILPCSENANAESFIGMLNFTPEVDNFLYPSGVVSHGAFNHRIMPISIFRSIDVLIDVGKIADVIVLLFAKDEPLDEWGRLSISILKSLGLPALMCVVMSSDGTPIPRETLVNYRRFIQTDLPDLERIIPVSSNDDLTQFVRFLSVTTPLSISWKDNRPLMLIQNFAINDGNNTIQIDGYLRNAPLNIHQIVSIPCVGDFHISSANGMSPSTSFRHPMIYRNDAAPTDIMDEEVHPPQTFELPDPLNPSEVTNNQNADGEEEDRFSDDGANDDQDDQDDNDPDIQQQELVWKRDTNELEFPDEFDYDNSILLRDRLRRYRGLKSFKSSPWDPHESLPPHFAQVFEFPSYSRTSEAAIAEQMTGEIMPNNRVTIVLSADAEEIKVWKRVPEGRVLSMIGLFRHETRFTVLNCSIHNNGPDLPSKTSLLLICGFRHMWIKPLFNEDHPAEKHMYFRTLPQGQHAMASFIAPAVMQSSPCTYFRENDGNIEFIGTGSVKTVDPCRMIIKRIILTGNPYRTSGKNARVSMMFFNKEDVQWFKPVGLWTKSKRRGHIEGTVGTKGRFKAKFNEIIMSNDTVCMSLYRRVFPPMDVAPVSF